MGEQKITRVYDYDNSSDKNERIYASHTDYIKTPNGQTLTTQLQEDKAELKKYIDDFKRALTVQLEGKVLGKAKCSDDNVIDIDTKLSEYYTQNIKLEGDATGSGTVDKTNTVTIQVTGLQAAKVPLPIGSIQMHTSNLSASQLSNCFGGTWECIGNIDTYIGGTYNEADGSYYNGTLLNMYIYKKTAL